MFLGGLSSFKLKKTRPSTPWVDVNLLSHVSESSTKTPTNRMRDIDGLRLHVPILEERETLKIPQSSDRLILSDHMNVMMLCGGYAGVHFTAEEMTQLISLASEFDKKFRLLEDYFNTLTTAQKSYLCKGSDAALPPPPPVPESSADCSLPSVPTEETLNDPMVVLFHSLADNVIEILCQLQPLIKFKQTHVPSIEMVIAEASSDSDMPSTADYLPRPRWLETLISKYQNHISAAGSKMPLPGTSCVLPPVGSLAAFLSCCVTEQIDCTKSEEAALRELILASNDHNGRVLPPHEQDIRSEIFSHTQKYWAARFFQFLKKLAELKSAIKDEASLYDFKKFL